MFGDIRKFVDLTSSKQTNQDCIANYKTLMKPDEVNNDELKNYYKDVSICLAEVGE